MSQSQEGGRSRERRERTGEEWRGRRVHIFITDRRTWRRGKGWGYVQPRRPFSPRSSVVQTKIRPAFESNPEIKRRLQRYKCHRLTAGGVAAHDNLRTIKKYVVRISAPFAGTDTQLSNRGFIRVDSRPSKGSRRTVTVRYRLSSNPVNDRIRKVTGRVTPNTSYSEWRARDFPLCARIAAWNKEAKTVGDDPRAVTV